MQLMVFMAWHNKILPFSLTVKNYNPEPMVFIATKILPFLLTVKNYNPEPMVSIATVSMNLRNKKSSIYRQNR
jgi:hypothetical protein